VTVLLERQYRHFQHFHFSLITVGDGALQVD